MKEILGVKLYTSTETASLLGVTPQTVIKYIKEGKLASRVIGGKNYITEQNIKIFVSGEK